MQNIFNTKDTPSIVCRYSRTTTGGVVRCHDHGTRGNGIGGDGMLVTTRRIL